MGNNARVGILGAGLSGVLMGMQLKRAGIDDFIIYEKQADVGGTWFRNTWPGLHCDVPSHLYSYSIEPNPNWDMAYASQPEIQAYIRSCAEKYGLLDHLQFETSVDTARFDEDSGIWALQLASGAEVQHQVIVSATGGLTEPNFPDITGLNDFTGPLWHSGAWRHDVDFTGLRVAVVGSAASAVQVVPEVAKHAGEMFVYQRSPNWVMPRNNKRFSEEEKRTFAEDPSARLRYWRTLYRQSLFMQSAFKRKPEAINGMRHVGLAHMRSAIKDPQLIDALTPNYEPGCKRIVVSDDYYPALAQDNASLITQPVTGMTPTGIVAADGSVTEVDVAIFCTGYKLGSRADGRPAVNVFGRAGERMDAALAKRPESYRGVAIPGFPNYFTVCGINGVAAYTSLFASAEIGTQFIADRISEIAKQNLKALEVDATATHEYNQVIQPELQKMSWATGQCTNFYRDRTGRVLSFYPGTLSRMRRELRAVGASDFVKENQ